MGLPKVTFAFLSPEIASSRLRAQIPQQELAKFGISLGRDVLVYGKHIVTQDQASHYDMRIYDVCDDHFHTMHEKYYRFHSGWADAVTVNTPAMAETVKRETGREAIVIPDPYESEEQQAGMGKGVLWFGHEYNLKTIDPYLPLIDRILTNPEWTRERQLSALKECSVVVIPTDERKGKSANRMIEAVRNGRFVVAGELPAHDEFKPFMWIGDIQEGIEWAKTHRAECIDRVEACQDYIRDKYSPSTIGKMWFEELGKLWQLRLMQN
jgi:hypothetical protein